MPLDRSHVLKPVKKLRKLIKRMNGRPSPGKVHDLRTNTRRFEATFEALELRNMSGGKSLRKRLSSLRKRAGKVRDMDVLLGYASGVHVKGEDECLAQLLTQLGFMRRKYAKKLWGEAKRLRPGVLKDLTRSIPKLTKLTDDGASREAAANAAASVMEIAADLTAPRRLGRNTLHPYRLKVRDLRNVLKMANRGSDRKFVDELGQVKDAIGEWHDWEELIPIAKKVLDHGSGCKLLAELNSIARRKYEHALSLTEAMRTHYLNLERPSKKGASQRIRKMPSRPVLEAAASLAG